MSKTVHKISCEACGLEGEIEIRGIMDISSAMPRRWKRRIINHRAYLLCDVCGHPRQFLRGISPYLLDALNLPPNASCEIEEEEDFSGSLGRGQNQWSKGRREARKRQRQQEKAEEKASHGEQPPARTSPASTSNVTPLPRRPRKT